MNKNPRQAAPVAAQVGLGIGENYLTCEVRAQVSLSVFAEKVRDRCREMDDQGYEYVGAIPFMEAEWVLIFRKLKK